MLYYQLNSKTKMGIALMRQMPACYRSSKRSMVGPDHVEAHQAPVMSFHDIKNDDVLR